MTWSGSRLARSTGTGLRRRQHLAIQEKKDGKVVDRMGQITDEQYRK